MLRSILSVSYQAGSHVTLYSEYIWCKAMLCSIRSIFYYGLLVSATAFNHRWRKTIDEGRKGLDGSGLIGYGRAIILVHGKHHKKIITKWKCSYMTNDSWLYYLSSPVIRRKTIAKMYMHVASLIPTPIAMLGRKEGLLSTARVRVLCACAISFPTIWGIRSIHTFSNSLLLCCC